MAVEQATIIAPELLAPPQNPYGEALWRDLESPAMDPVLPFTMKRFNLAMRRIFPEIEFLQTECTCSGHLESARSNRIDTVKDVLFKGSEVLPYLTVCVSHEGLAYGRLQDVYSFLKYIFDQATKRAGRLMILNETALALVNQWPETRGYDKPIHFFDAELRNEHPRERNGFQSLSSFWYAFRDVLEEFDGINDPSELRPKDFIKKPIKIY